ncbi:MAG TPA: restriction endonuclease, partial [Polyangia bacterium]
GKWGWVSFEQATASTPGTDASEIEKRILEANTRLDQELRKRLEGMDWRTFESSFLQTVLERLGFQDVEITQATRDGGVDAHIRYKLGIVDAAAIVSAKRWASSKPVPRDEVQLLRGIDDEAAVGIIVTTGKFSADAENEARKGRNLRLIYLIDGSQLIDVMKRFKIGVKKQEMQELLVLDEAEFRSIEAPEENSDASTRPDAVEDQPSEAKVLTRFWENMLDEIAVPDLANLLGLQESTVRVYMATPPRREDMAKRIRGDESLKANALSLVERSRMAN